MASSCFGLKFFLKLSVEKNHWNRMGCFDFVTKIVENSFARIILGFADNLERYVYARDSKNASEEELEGLISDSG